MRRGNSGAMNVAMERWRPSGRSIGALTLLWAMICTANAVWALWLSERLASSEAPPIIVAFFFGDVAKIRGEEI